ncbi:unnamed protein product, partial [Mesorhabditis belari]|uniref:Uncharacterized protein n=1 Tax=Mesorhabditis belari TaxID=2138241 RepID=A0AAF3J2Y9_9BILA
MEATSTHVSWRYKYILALQMHRLPPRQPRHSSFEGTHRRDLFGFHNNTADNSLKTPNLCVLSLNKDNSNSLSFASLNTSALEPGEVVTMKSKDPQVIFFEQCKSGFLGMSTPSTRQRFGFDGYPIGFGGNYRYRNYRRPPPMQPSSLPPQWMADASRRLFFSQI